MKYSEVIWHTVRNL